MFLPSLFKNKKFVYSNRNYLSDYSKTKSKLIDMTLSGRYLSSYNKLKIDSSEFDKYPSRIGIEKLENTIKIHEQTDRELLLTSGANGALQNIVKILFRKKGNLVTPFYTFDQVEFAVTSLGSWTKRVYMADYNIDFKKIMESLDKKTRMIYICNPNNPTGIYADNDKIISLAKKIKIPIVIDESGIEFTGKKSLLSYKQLPDNLIIVRSFSKAYGLANFRIGYIACSPHFKQTYLENITTNEFSGLSCVIANHMLEHEQDNIRINIERIISEREKMINQLEKINIKCIKSNSNTIMTITTFDDKFMKELTNRQVSVVPIKDECNLTHIRIAIQDPSTNKKFLSIISNIVKDFNK